VRHVLVIATLGTALSLALAGCGGGGTSPEQEWASSVCTSISAWQTEINTVTSNAANALAQPGATRKDVDDAIDQGVAATQTLIDDLKQLGGPDTAEGAQAKQQVDAFLAEAKAALGGVQSAIKNIPAGEKLTTIVTQLSGQAVNLQRTIASGKALIGSLEGMGGDLKDGFEKADSCKDLR
jgi:hypothetical protein